jgi:hypothetical protein
MKTLYSHIRKMPMFSLANVVLILIAMVLVTGCAGAYNAPAVAAPAVNSASIFVKLPYEETRQGVVEIMRQVDPNAKAYFNTITRQWAYTWPSGEQQVYAYAKGTGELLKGGGTVFKGSPQLLANFEANLTSRMGGYQQWIGPAVAALAMKRPDMLISIMTMPAMINNSAPPDSWDFSKYMDTETYCKYFGCTVIQ